MESLYVKARKSFSELVWLAGGDFTKFHGNVRLMTASTDFNTDVEAFILSYGSNY